MGRDERRRELRDAWDEHLKAIEVLKYEIESLNFADFVDARTQWFSAREMGAILLRRGFKFREELSGSLSFRFFHVRFYALERNLWRIEVQGAPSQTGPLLKALRASIDLSRKDSEERGILEEVLNDMVKRETDIFNDAVERE